MVCHSAIRAPAGIDKSPFSVWDQFICGKANAPTDRRGHLSYVLYMHSPWTCISGRSTRFPMLFIVTKTTIAKRDISRSGRGSIDSRVRAAESRLVLALIPLVILVKLRWHGDVHHPSTISGFRLRRFKSPLLLPVTVRVRSNPLTEARRPANQNHSQSTPDDKPPNYDSEAIRKC